VEPTDIGGYRHRSEDEQLALQRRKEIAALLDELGPDSDAPEDSWPRDWRGRPIQLGIHNGDEYEPIVQSQEDWDRASIEREDLFFKRFRVDWPRHDRAQLFEVKNRHDLTDREIRVLSRAGSLRRTDGRVSIQANRWIFLLGWLQIATLACYFLALLLGLMAHPPSTLQQISGSIGFSMVLFAVGWVIHGAYVRPWQIFRRAMTTALDSRVCTPPG
jgi:hypothetical protein